MSNKKISALGDALRKAIDKSISNVLPDYVADEENNEAVSHIPKEYQNFCAMNFDNIWTKKKYPPSQMLEMYKVVVAKIKMDVGAEYRSDFERTFTNMLSVEKYTKRKRGGEVVQKERFVAPPPLDFVEAALKFARTYPNKNDSEQDGSENYFARKMSGIDELYKKIEEREEIQRKRKRKLP